METPHLFSLPTTARWRAKLCRLGNNSWRVFEEGEVYGEYDENSGTYALIMENRLESGRSTIFRSIIRSPVAFQKQESLLLWIGPKKDINSGLAAHCPEDEFWQDENGLARVAFAFQAIPGCVIMSEFVLHAICQSKNRGDMVFAVQQNSCISEGTSSLAKSEPTPSSSTILSPPEAYAEVLDEPIDLPPLPTIENLETVKTRIAALRQSNFGRELLTVFLVTNEYFNQLWLVFDFLVSPGTSNGKNKRLGKQPVDTNPDCDELTPLERMQKLWQLSDILKLYIKSSDVLMVDKLMEYNNFVKLLSILEYDREFGARKANFCHYYCRQTGMKQIIDMTNSPILDKIQGTFRLKMLRDILVRSFDEPTHSIIRHLINMNHADILESILLSPEYCSQLFSLFMPVDEHSPLPFSKARDDAVEFLNELMKTSRIYPMAQLKHLYLRLLESGLVRAITYGLHSDRCSETKLLTLETLSLVAEIDSTLILPPKGASILFAIVSMIYNTQYFAKESNGKTPSKMHAGIRAVQLESFDLLKKLICDFSSSAFECFFQTVEQTMACLDTSRLEPEQIIPLLNMNTLCFSTNRLVTSQMMIHYNIWGYLGHLVASLFQNRNHMMKSPKVCLALIQLIRDAIMPVSTGSSELCAHQVGCIIRSGIPGHLIKEMCSRPNLLYGAERSSVLSLIYMIVNGRTPGISNHLTMVENWFINVDPINLHSLCEIFPEFELIVPPHLLEDFGRDEDQTCIDDSLNANIVSASTTEEFSPSSVESLDSFESSSLMSSTGLKRSFSQSSGVCDISEGEMTSQRLKLENPPLPSIVTEFDREVPPNSPSSMHASHTSLVPSLINQSWWNSNSILTRSQLSGERYAMFVEQQLSIDHTEE